MISSVNEIIAGSSFILSTADALYCICIRNNTRRVGITVLISIWRLGKLTLWKNKPNKSRKSESIPFSHHGSHLYLDLLCPSTAATTDMMYWETGQVKIIIKETFHLHAVLLPFFPIERASKILPGKVCHLA